MPQTPILALPYPAATDPADVPTDMGELANRVEAVRGAINGLASLGADGRVPTAQLPTPASVAYGITLPASPTDGQEAILVDSITNPSYQWRFRYNAGSSSAYKWEFVGGTDAWHAVWGESSFSTSDTWTDLDGNPFITLPRAGDYDSVAAASCRHTLAAATVVVYLALARNSTVPGGDQYTGTSPAIADAKFALSPVSWRATAMAANDILRIRYGFAGGGTARWSERWLRVRPLRVS